MLFYVIAGVVVGCDRFKNGEFICKYSRVRVTDSKIGNLVVFASSANTCLEKDFLYFTCGNTTVECKEGTFWVFIVVTTSVWVFTRLERSVLLLLLMEFYLDVAKISDFIKVCFLNLVESSFLNICKGDAHYCIFYYSITSAIAYLISLLWFTALLHLMCQCW